MGTSKAGRWIAAALLLSACAACSWLLLVEATDGPAPIVSTPADARPLGAPRSAARRSAAGSAPTTDASKPTVEIDDAPFPSGASLTIRGTVRDGAGAPVANAGVIAEAQTDRPSGFSNGSRTTRAGADGAYVFEKLDPRTAWSLGASADGFVPSDCASAVLATTKRLELRYDFVLPRLGAIDVVVLDDAGAPIAHRSWIRRLTPRGGDSDIGSRGLAPGKFRVFVAAPGRAAEIRDVDVADGATARADFRLAPEVEIAGVLLGAGGEPMEGYDVVAVAADEAPPFSDHRAKTARDGGFSIRGLRRTRYEVRPDDAGPDCLELAADGGERVDAPADAVRLQVRVAATAAFHLVYPPELPASRRSADVGVVEIFRSREMRVVARWEYDRGWVKVPGGEDVELVIDVPGCLQFRRHVVIRPDDTFDVGDVALVQERDISGRVVDAAGVGVPMTIVVGRFGDVRCNGGGAQDGAFRLVRVPPTDGVIDAWASGFADATTACGAGQTAPVVIVLHRGGRLHVQAQRADGTPLGGAALRLLAADGGVTAATLDALTLDAFGEFAMRVPAGRRRVDVAGCDPVDAEIREGATTSVSVRAK